MTAAATADFRQSVSERIVLAMWRHGRMSNQALANATGISNHTIGRKLRGLGAWSIEELLPIAAALEVPITDLLPDRWALWDSNPEPAD